MAAHGSSKAPGAAYYIVSFMALASVLIVAAVLAGVFWLSRPVNLEPETNRLADALERVLRDNYVPERNIERGPPAEQSAPRDNIETRWTAHEFTVTLPPELNSEGFKTQLRKDMSIYFVRLTDRERDPENNYDRISLYLDDLPFAELTLIPGKSETAEVYRSDLRNSSIQLANLVAGVLEELPSSRRYARQPAEERADLGALWQYTGFSVALPPGVTPGELKSRLEARNTLPNAVVGTASGQEPDYSLLVSLDGKPCVGVSCTLAPAGDSPRPEPLSLDAVLSGSIMGSEPEEESKLPSGEIVETPIAAPPVPAPVAAIRAPLNPDPVPPAARDSADPAHPARLALIIDDGGYSNSRADQVLALDNRLTLAILPNTPFAVETAERGAALGFEIILHMPMETDSGTEEAVPGTIFTAMGKAEIQELTNKVLDQIPNVAGINNHTGSKFTTNKKKMGFVLEVLKKRGLFFIDSVTIHTSVAHAAAMEMGVPTARRDVFLDNEATEANVRSQFALLLQMARDKGAAIGIGHFQSPATARVLADEIPKLADANIVLVHASELVQ